MPRFAIARARRTTSRSLFAVPALIIVFTTPLLAQEGWEDINPPPQASSEPSSLRPLSVGIEVGRPLVFGVTASYNFNPHTSAHFGFSSLGDFTAISGEMRYSLIGIGTQRALPSLGGGFTQYFLNDGDRESSPTVGHVLVGLEYIFPYRLGIGGTVGYQAAIGTSGDGTVERYGIDNDVAEWFFAVSGRYFF